MRDDSEFAGQRDRRHLTYDDLVRELKVSKATLYRWIKLGRVPPPQYLGAQARFPLSWLQQLDDIGLMPPGHYTPTGSLRSTIATRTADKKRAAGKKKRTRPGGKKEARVKS